MNNRPSGKKDEEAPGTSEKKDKKHVVLEESPSTLSHKTDRSVNQYSKTRRNHYVPPDVLSTTSALSQSYGRRRSVDSRASEAETLIGHALHDVVSEHIMAAPHGALLSIPSMDSVTSTKTVELLYLRRKTFEGADTPVDFDDAITETGHGCFQYKLMALCGFIYSCCSLSTTTLSFVLPAAQYDFHLKSVDKGILNTAPLLGMVVGAYIWGNFADTKGRKFVILCSLFIDAFAAFLSSLCQKYSLFFVCRLFNGFGIIGATSMVFAYLGEFLDHSKRDRYLSRLELFWTFGIIAIPVIGVAILPRDWSLGSADTFLFDSWRLFVFACGVPSLLAALIMLHFPESPRFLLLKGKHDKTRQVLVKMFVSNTKRQPDEYPVKVLDMSYYGSSFHSMRHSAGRCRILRKFFWNIYRQHKELFRGKSLFNIIVTCFIDAGLMSVYFSIVLWVPELLHREEQYMETHPTGRATLCEVEKEVLDSVDYGKIELSTFVHAFIICLACLPGNIMLLFVISYVSKKVLIVSLMLMAAVPTFAVYFMDTPFKVTTMMCLFEATSTLVETVLFCAIVDIFPMSTRGSALAMTVTFGRLGAVLGNIAFGFLIDTYCDFLFFGMASILIVSGLSALLLPEMSKGHGGS